jgi:hypothetical protein
MRPLRRAVAALALTGCAALTPQQEAKIVDDAEGLACVLAEGLTQRNTAQLIAFLCNVPLGQVVTILNAQQSARARASDWVLSHPDAGVQFP